jgi:hypothetical protein
MLNTRQQTNQPPRGHITRAAAQQRAAHRRDPASTSVYPRLGTVGAGFCRRTHDEGMDVTAEVSNWTAKHFRVHAKHHPTNRILTSLCGYWYSFLLDDLRAILPYKATALLKAS